MVEEDYPNKRKLFRPDFGKKAKDRVDAMKNLASISLVFFGLVTPKKEKDSFKGQW